MIVLAASYSAWGFWIAFNIIAFAVGVRFPPDCPCFTGFRIMIPAWATDYLTVDEMAAVIAHEEGHRHHLHVWRNLVAACMFLPVDRAAQEHQADDYAARRGHRLALAAALTKMSNHPWDTARAKRLATR